MHRKFNDDINARCLVIMNIQGRFWGLPVTSSMTSSSWKYIFCIIWDDIFLSEVKLKLCFIFQNFQNSRHFELQTNFFHR